MEQILLRFTTHLTREEKSPATVEKYIRDAKRFLIFLGGQAITKERAIAFKSHLLSTGYSPRSINAMLASVNCLLLFLKKPACRLKALKLQRAAFCPEERELSHQEYTRLVATARRQGNERLCLILQTICATGIRVSELQFITAEAVHRGEATVNCKGKTRRIFLVRRLQKKILCYMKQQRITSGAVFLTRSGKPLHRSHIWREMKSLCQEAGVTPGKVFPHNLRHLFARAFYNVDKDIARLADVLGHSSIDTTRIYIATTSLAHRRQMEHLHLVL